MGNERQRPRLAAPRWQQPHLRTGGGRNCEAEGGVAARAPNRSASHGGSGEGAAGCVSRRRRAARACSSPRPYVRRRGGASASGTGKARVGPCGCQQGVGNTGQFGRTWGTSLLMGKGDVSWTSFPPGEHGEHLMFTLSSVAANCGRENQAKNQHPDAKLLETREGPRPAWRA